MSFFFFLRAYERFRVALLVEADGDAREEGEEEEEEVEALPNRLSSSPSSCPKGSMEGWFRMMLGTVQIDTKAFKACCWMTACALNSVMALLKIPIVSASTAMFLYSPLT